MDLNKFTTKLQEALQAAQTKAIRFGHMEVEGEHLLLALIEQEDGLIPPAAPEDGGAGERTAGPSRTGTDEKAASQRSGC